ncbi:MAG: electron transfer flavoprotein subunit beta, partial [Bacteroidota bacterium]
MQIIVCIKQVPDTTEVRIDPKTGTMIRDGVPSIINPDDKSGLEAALRLKEEVGGTVTVLTMGPPQAEAALKEAIAMGADRAILLTDRVFAGADTWATSKALAGALKKLSYDLVIAGRQAIDGDTAQVGPQIAEHLGLPHVAYVGEISPESNRLVVKRMFEDGYQRIRV